MPWPNVSCRFGAPLDVEPVGIVERARVAVGRCLHEQHPLSLADLPAAERQRLARPARHRADRPVVAQALLGRAAGQIGIAVQPLPLVGVLLERDDAVGQQVHRRLVAGEDHQDDVGDDLLVAEGVGALARLQHARDQVVLRPRAAGGEHRAQERLELLHRALGVGEPVVVVTADEDDAAQVVGPQLDPVARLGRDAEVLGDHDHRQVERELTQEVDLVAAAQRRQQLLDEVTDPDATLSTLRAVNARLTSRRTRVW